MTFSSFLQEERVISRSRNRNNSMVTVRKTKVVGQKRGDGGTNLDKQS